LKFEKVDLEAEQAKPYSDCNKEIPARVAWGRHAYKVLVDGEHRAFLVLEGSYGNQRWIVYTLHESGKITDGDGQRVHSRDKNHALKMSDWLAEKFDVYKYPTAAEIEAQQAERREREARRQAEWEKKRAEQRQAAKDRKAAAQTALDGLVEIEGLQLTNFQRHALTFALGEVRKIAEGG
jgi:hypothetical protein